MDRLLMTGGSGGIGHAVRTLFESKGWSIEAPRRNEVDLKSRASIFSFFGRQEVDLLICAAGMTKDTVLIRSSESDWDEVYAINYQAAESCALAVLPRMIEQKKGHIVFISSFSALHPPIGQVAYASAKAALLGLTKVLAAQYGTNGIRVNAILPGFLETRMTETVSPARKLEVLNEHSIGRLNTPQIVAKYIYFLHEELSETSGQVFQLDSRIS